MQASYLAGGAQDFGDTVAGIDEGAGEPGPIGVSALDADRQDVACGGESVDERLVTVFVGVERRRGFDTAGVGQDCQRVCLVVGVDSGDEAGSVVKSWAQWSSSSIGADRGSAGTDKTLTMGP